VRGDPYETTEHHFEDDLEERDDVVDPRKDDGGDEAQRDGETWAKTSSGNADDDTSNG
jgi:hypothetical protein